MEFTEEETAELILEEMLFEEVVLDNLEEAEAVFDEVTEDFCNISLEERLDSVGKAFDEELFIIDSAF